MRNHTRASHFLLAIGLAAAGLVTVVPAASALTPTDDVALMMSGGYTYVDVLANDDSTGNEYVDVVPGADPRVTGTFGADLQVDLTDLAATVGESFSVDYQVLDAGSGEPVGATARLTVHALPATARAEAADREVAIRWPDLPAAVDGVRITYGEGFVIDHDDPDALDTLTLTGRPPWTVPGLQNGTTYGFYVTPRVGDVELDSGSYLDATPRASNSAPVARDDTVSLVGPDPVEFYPTDNDEDPDSDSLTIASHTQPAVGTLQCESVYCTYDPGPVPSSTSFDYTVSDGYGGTSTATVQLVARDVTLVDDAFTGLFADEDAVVDVRGNDSGLLAGDELYFEFASLDVYAYEDESGRTVVNAASAGTYDGTYTAWTAQGQELGSAAIRLTVGPRRTLVAVDDLAYTEMEVATEVEVGLSDRIGDADFPLSTTATKLTDQPAHGVASLAFEAMSYNDPDGVFDPVLRNLPVVTYTPDAGYRGEDTLTYELVDAQGDHDTATVGIEVSAAGAYVYADSVGVSSASLDISYTGSPAIDDVLLCYTVGTTREDFPEPPASRECSQEVPTTGTPETVPLVGLTPDRWHSVSLFTHYDDGTTGGLWVGPDTTDFRTGVDPVSDVWVEAGPGNALITWLNPSADDGLVPSTGTTIGWSTDAAPQQPGTGSGWTTVGAGVDQVAISGLVAGTTYHFSIFATATNSWADPVSGIFTPEPGNGAPSAVDDSLSVGENDSDSLDVLANDTDPDGDALTVREYTQPTHGYVDCYEGTCYYSPDSGYSGPDSFTYTISDGRFGVATGRVDVTVVGVPDPPIAQDESLTVTQGIPRQIDLSDLVHDPDGTTAFTYAIVTAPVKGTMTGCSTTTGACTYTGTTPGEDSFVYKATDPTGLSATGTVTITVVANQPPVTSTGSVQVASGGQVAIDLRDYASDPDTGDTLTFSEFTAPAKGSVSCTAAGACSYTAGAGTEGTDSFVYRVTDDKGASTTGSVQVSITRVNHAPVATDASRTTENTGTLGVDLAGLVTDPDGDDLLFELVSGPTPGAAGSVSCGGAGLCTYAPAPTFTGQMTFTYRASDGDLDSNLATVTVTVTQANRAPVADDESTSAVTGEATTIDVAAGDVDPDGDALSYAKASDPTHGTASCTTAGTCTYTSAPGYSGPDSFTYTVSDARGGSDTATVSVTVGANQAPVATDDSATTRTGHAVTVQVGANDSDPEHQALTYAKASDPSHGTATCTPSGACTYTPAGGYAGADAFTYSVSDGHGGQDTGAVAVTVKANRAPVADDESAAVAAGTPVAVDVAAGDTDPDGDSLSFARAGGPAHGSVTCTAAGVCTYTSTAAYNGQDSFTYTVSDGEGGQDVGTVSLTVTYTPPTQPTPPAPTISVDGAPKVKGMLVVGKVLKARAGAYSPAATKVSYRWLRNGKAIKKATKASYRLTRKDRGKRISLRITYTLPGATTVTKVVKLKGKVKR